MPIQEDAPEFPWSSLNWVGVSLVDSLVGAASVAAIVGTGVAGETRVLDGGEGGADLGFGHDAFRVLGS